VEPEGESSKVNIFDLLQKRFPKAVHRSNAAGETPLHVAAWNVRLDIVRRLCDAGVDVNATDRGGRTAYDKIMLRKASDNTDPGHLLLRQKSRQETESILKFLHELQN
jgi:ankyrin repeat protein